jgi:hypothetical protein
MVRDFAFSTSRKFVVDMMNTDVMGKEVMAISMYPKEGNPTVGRIFHYCRCQYFEDLFRSHLPISLS